MSFLFVQSQTKCPSWESFHSFILNTDGQIFADYKEIFESIIELDLVGVRGHQYDNRVILLCYVALTTVQLMLVGGCHATALALDWSVYATSLNTAATSYLKVLLFHDRH